MEKGTTHVALDDSKRKIAAGILRPEATESEVREIPNDPHHIRRLFERLKREGPVVACYEAGVSGYDLYRQLMSWFSVKMTAVCVRQRRTRTVPRRGNGTGGRKRVKGDARCARRQTPPRRGRPPTSQPHRRRRQSHR